MSPVQNFLNLFMQYEITARKNSELDFSGQRYWRYLICKLFILKAQKGWKYSRNTFFIGPWVS